MTDPRRLALTAEHADIMGELKARVRAARTEALRTLNTQLICLYWSLGKTTPERQAIDGGGVGWIGVERWIFLQTA